MKKYLQELILKMFERKWVFFENLSKICHFDDVIAEQVTSSKKLLCQHVPYMVGFHRGKFYHYNYSQSKVMLGGRNPPPPKKNKLRTIKKPRPIRVKTCILINGNTSLNTDENGGLFSPYSVVFYAVNIIKIIWDIVPE